MLGRLFDLLSVKERKQAVFLLIFIFIGMLLEILSIGLVFPLFSAIFDPGFADLVEEYVGPAIDTQVLIITTITAFFGLYVIKTIFLVLILKKQLLFVYTLQADLSRRLFESYLMQDYSFHIQRSSPELIRNTITEVNLLVQNGVLQLITLIAEVSVLVGVICFLLYMEPLVTLAATIIVAAVGGGFFQFVKSRILSWGEERQLHEALRIQHVQQGLGGIKEIKLLGKEYEFVSRFGFHTDAAAKVWRLAATTHQYPRLLLELVGVFIISLFMLTIVIRGIQIDELLPVLAVFAAASLRLIPSANRIVSALQVARFSLPAVHIIHTELHDFVKSNREDMISASSLIFRRDIVLDDIYYKYPSSGEYSLSNINLTIKHGDTVGFIGSSGAGKSTIVDLILGLLPPNLGTVCVDGANIEEHIRAWQSLIGYVPQTVYLSDESLRANIAYGIPEDDIDELAVAAAIKSAQLSEFIESLPDGIYTSVGERGVRISGGQLQRLGIARALYNDPNILVLDEATSALDLVTEAGVMDSIRGLQGHKTIIIVTHRYSTVQHCNMIYKLQDGKIIGQGSPGLLLEGTI